MCGKRRLPSGDCEMPIWTMSCGGRRVMFLPWKVIVPSRGWLSPLIERSVVDLPAPFAPISVTDLALVRLERDPLQRLDRPVEGVDALELEDDVAVAGRGRAHAVAAFPR